jgi:membrane-bound lytic murein transglycosylase D
MLRASSVRLIFILGLLCALVSGCASSRSKDRSKDNLDSGRSDAGQSFRVSDPELPPIVDQELDTIPVEMNPLVERWIQYFQTRGRPHMERYLARSTRYMSLMKRILRKNGLPEDLIYIALIESGFSSRATSHASAVGYWQFIRGTGKRYGMEISTLIDERRDPVLSTQAAAEYFKGLYSIFGSWYLSMASYNVGENRVKREIMQNYTRDFWDLARKRRLPRETINYVPKFVAAKLIAKNPEKYGFSDIEYEPPIEFDVVKVDRPVNLRLMAEKMGLEYSDFKTLNPKFKGEVAPTRNDFLELRIPTGQREVALVAAQQSFVDKVAYVADAGETQVHRVRSGDSLHTIAKKYRTTVAWLRDSNDLKTGRPLRIGQKLMVPDRGEKIAKATKEKAVATAVKPAAQIAKVNNTVADSQDVVKAKKNPEIINAKGVFYIVQKGDTLSSIAEEYDSTVGELRRMNKLSKSAMIKVGAKIKVPKDDEGLPSDPSGKSDEESSPSDQAGGDKTDESSIQTQKRSPNMAFQNRKKIMRKVHVVKRGENLSHIAKKYNISMQSLKEKNQLKAGSVLVAGSRLFIPN